MYVEAVPNRNSPPAVLLRESYRQQGKVHKRTLANLSDWDPGRVEALRRALRGDFDHLLCPDPTSGSAFGLLFVLKRLADTVGLTAALDELAARQANIEQALYRSYLQRCGSPPRLFLYDITSSYLEGQHNALGDYGYPRDGKRGKLQIVVGLLTEGAGEPLAVRVVAGNAGDPVTVVDQVKILQSQFGVQELVFVGDRGMVKSKCKQALREAGLHHISALTDPQIRRLLGGGDAGDGLVQRRVVRSGGRRFALSATPKRTRGGAGAASLGGRTGQAEGQGGAA